jgi:hypothetical protein
MEASSSAGAKFAPAQVERRATPEARQSDGQGAFLALLFGGVLLLYAAIGYGLYEFLTFVF